MWYFWVNTKRFTYYTSLCSWCMIHSSPSCLGNSLMSLLSCHIHTMITSHHLMAHFFKSLVLSLLLLCCFRVSLIEVLKWSRCWSDLAAFSKTYSSKLASSLGSRAGGGGMLASSLGSRARGGGYRLTKPCKSHRTKLCQHVSCLANVSDRHCSINESHNWVFQCYLCLC